MPEPPDLRQPDAMISLMDRAAEAMLGSRWRSGAAERLPAAGRLLVTGDLHDNPMHFARVVALADLERGDDRHLLLQELIHGERLINGMDFSHRMLGRVADLVLRYPGQVHPILANHELSQLTGRGVSKGGGNSVELFDEALGFVYGEHWEAVAAAIDRFIAAMPLAVTGEAGLLCAHSLPSARAMARFDPDVLGRSLTDEDRAGPHGSAYLMVWGRQYTAESARTLAERWSVELFCLGHQHVESGIEAFDSIALLLNSDHAQGRALSVDLAALPSVEEAIMYAVPVSAGS
ncbi:MAG: metallophosphoesterase [Planctomycetota bacterium]